MQKLMQNASGRAGYMAVVTVIMIMAMFMLANSLYSQVAFPEREASGPPPPDSLLIMDSDQDMGNELVQAISQTSVLPRIVEAVYEGKSGQASITDANLQGFPFTGSSYIVLSTGPADQITGKATDFSSVDMGGIFIPGGSPDGLDAYDVATLRIKIDLSDLPQDARLVFRYKFLSEEPPQYWGSEFQDYFTAYVRDASGNVIKNIARLPNEDAFTIDNARPWMNQVTGSSINPLPPYPSPDDTVFNAVTGIHTTDFKLSDWIGQTIELELQIGDVSDAILDSAVFIDGLEIQSGGLPDFWVDKVEFNQASQSFADENVKVAAEQLVTGKATGVRVYVVGDNNEANPDEGKEAKRVTANLHIYRNDEEIIGSPFKPAFFPIAPVANPSRTANQNGRATQTLDFFLPSFTNPGEYQFFVYVNPDHQEDESDYSNNIFPSEGFETVTFHQLEKVTVLPVHVTTVDGDGNVVDAFTDDDWSKLQTQRLVTNRTNPRTIDWRPAQTMNWNLDQTTGWWFWKKPVGDLSTKDGRDALLAEMVDRSKDAGTHTAIAILPETTTLYDDALGWGSIGRPGAMGLTSHDNILAHELMHNQLPDPHFFGQKDAYHDNTNSGNDGYDPYSLTLKLNKTNILGTYAANDTWISPTTYKALFENHELLPSDGWWPFGSVLANQLQQEESDALRIIGWIDEDGDLQLRPIRTVKSDVLTPEDSEGNFLLELLDGNGDIIYDFRFSLPLLSGEDDLEYGPFSLVVPRPEALDSIRFREIIDSALKHNYDFYGQIDYSQESHLATIPVSANPPTVDILSPSGGEIVDGTLTIQWEGYDPDGDEIYYTVLYSADEHDWNVLSTNLVDTSLEWDFSSVPGSTEAFIRISATDGVNSASDQSGAFTVSDKPPETYIMQPESDKAFKHGEYIVFEGGADDLEDGELTGDQLEWTSDIDGLFGTGENVVYAELSLGTHIITLTATDSDGHKTAEAIEITVIDTVPSPPANVQATPGDNNVYLQWDASYEEYLAGYRVYWGMSSGVYGNDLDVGIQTSHTVMNLANGSIYYFAVRAYDVFGNYSYYSEEVQAVPEPIYFKPTPSLTSPAHGKIVPGSSVALNWAPVTGATHYAVWIYNLTKEEKVILTAPMVETSYTFEGLADNGDIYAWSVVASDANEGNWGDFATPLAFINGSDKDLLPPTLTLPEHLGTVPGTGVLLEWEASAGADIYTILVANLDTGEYVDGYDGSQLFTGTSHLVEGLSGGGATYFWSVCAADSSEPGVWSDYAFPRLFINE